MQNGVVAGAHQRDAVVANVGSLVEKARREETAPGRTAGTVETKEVDFGRTA